MTDHEYEHVYAEGRQAWQRDFGTHGPTLYPRVEKNTMNPYTDQRALVWDAGYRQDIRRIKV